MKCLLKFCLTLSLLLTVNANVHAWDNVGHRLASSIALEYLSDTSKAKLLKILQQHPRFQQDFIEPMPRFVKAGDELQRLNWLLGQAAYWPDRVRSLSTADRQRFNRPRWHYIDGAWLRDNAQTQGNIYLGIEKFTAINGRPAASIIAEAQVDNVMTALDYNSRLLADPTSNAAIRAIALCWVLHLAADIHQPLHAGSLYSGELFSSGDRGGNRIATDDGNLHARWDRALASEGLAFHSQAMLKTISQSQKPAVIGVTSDWSRWLDESRELLHEQVYSATMVAEITAAEKDNRPMSRTSLDPGYVAQMKRSARQRLEQAGLRLAIWIENELN